MPVVVTTNSVSGVASITSNSTSAVQFYNSAGTQTLGAVNVDSINGGAISGIRNRIINGNFDIWQRSTSQTIGNTANTQYFTADRWFNFFDGSGGTRTVSRQTFALGQTDVPNNPKYFYRLDQTVAGTGATYNLITQRIESVLTLAGQQATVSFWAKASTSIAITVNLSQGFGTGGTPSANNSFYTSTSCNLTTSWQKFSFTTTITSISGKTLGTNNDDNLTVQFLCPLNSTFTLDIAQVQLEDGPVATEFEPRSYGQELLLCQRYYYKATTPATARYGAGHNALTTTGVHSLVLPVTMRAAPTSVETTGTATDYDIQNANTATTCSSVPAFTAASTNLVTLSSNVASGLTVGQGSSLRSTSASSFLAVSAEL